MRAETTTTTTTTKTTKETMTTPTTTTTTKTTTTTRETMTTATTTTTTKTMTTTTTTAAKTTATSYVIVTWLAVGKASRGNTGCVKAGISSRFPARCVSVEREGERKCTARPPCPLLVLGLFLSSAIEL